MNTQLMLAVVGIGTLLVTAGTIRIVMTMFGYKLIPAWENTFHVKLPKIEFGFETKNLGIAACFVGVFLIGTPPFINHYLGPIAKLNAQENHLPIASPQELDGYSAAEETVWLDLTQRKPLSDWERMAGNFSPANWSARLVVKEVKPDAEEIALRFATSGAGIKPLELPTGTKWEKSKKTEDHHLYNPYIDILRGTNLFKTLFEKNGTMRTYFMRIPVKETSNQEFWYELSFLNAFQGEREEWAGKVVHADTDLITMNIAYPEDKPITGYQVFREPEHGKVRLPIANPDIQLSPDNTHVTWKIADAKKGERYLIKWEW